MRIVVFYILVMLACAVQAQVRMIDVFKSMPDSLVPYLTANNRLDCLDFKEAKMKAEVQNALGGKSELVTLNGQYADLQLNDAHRMEMRLLDTTEPVDSCLQLIGIIHTYGTDVQESKVQFYSLRWHELPVANYITLPQEMFTVTFDETQSELTIISSNYFDQPASEDQKPEEKSSINLKWLNNSFK